MEVTTTDKLQALAQTFTEPQFYLTLGGIILFLAFSGRSKKTAQRTALTMTGRLGLVLYWSALLVALVLFGIGSLVLANASAVTDNTLLFVAIWWVPAVIIWLLGKAARFILTAPA